MMKMSTNTVLIDKAINLILDSMIDTDIGDLCRAEEKLATAIIFLNQISGLSKFKSEERQNQFDYCCEIILGTSV